MKIGTLVKSSAVMLCLTANVWAQTETVTSSTGAPPTPLAAELSNGPANPVSFTGSITYIEVEGGFYGITANDGRKFLPIHLPEMLKQAGTLVSVEAVPAKATVGIHMWGEYIELQRISVLPPCN